MKEHKYVTTIEWTGNTGAGTADYKSYERSHSIIIENKPPIHASSDPAFRGDKTRHNPEELFVSSFSSCHMLWYLHLCAVNNIVVEQYTDIAEGIMMEENSGKGHFTEIILQPTVVVKSQDMVAKAIELHEKANEYCFMANSVKFPVRHRVRVVAMSE
ncbi:MAG TPA: OsmC family protein [Cyclobacteriaceae bacterium]|nr:OsmC family protein [Cyclobacteriaceae bacterium]